MAMMQRGGGDAVRRAAPARRGGAVARARRCKAWMLPGFSDPGQKRRPVARAPALPGGIAFLSLAALLFFALSAFAPARAETRQADLALGLAGVVSWSAQQPFIDVMKTARPFFGHKPGEWGGADHDDLRARGLVDAHGWPTAIPPDLRAIGTVFLNDMTEDAVSLAGKYRLTYAGQGIIELGGRARNTRRAAGQMTFDYTPGGGAVILNITKTDPDDPIRDIKVVKIGNAERLAEGAIFNPDWTRRIAGFGMVRFMDWMATNDSAQSAWADRPVIADATWSDKGVPVEIMVALANKLQADPWFTMPHLATDAYMRRFAEYVLRHLDPGLTAHVEYSNEVWNWQFQQTRWAEEQARGRWGQDHAGDQFYALRAAEMARLWRGVFDAGGAPDRLVTVISTQTGWLGRERDILAAPLYVAEVPGNRPPAEAFDAYAVTGYFSARLGDEDKADTLHGWLRDSLSMAEAAADAQGLSAEARAAHVAAHRYDHAVALAARELRDGSVTGDARGSLAELFAEVFPHHAEVASRHGLDLLMYEGGTHVVGIGKVAADDALADFFMYLNYTPEMGRLYRELVAGWAAAGGQRFNVFADVYPPNRWGSWGALRHLDDQNPRWDALTAPSPVQGAE